MSDTSDPSLCDTLILVRSAQRDVRMALRLDRPNKFGWLSEALSTLSELERRAASAMSAGTAETTQIGSGLQPASAAPKEDAR